jgi:CcmD family protein
MKRLLCFAAAVAVACLVHVSPASAEGSGAAAPTAYSADRLSKEGFVPAAPGQAVEDSVPGGLLMLTAYGVLWTLVGGYLWRLSRRTAATQRDLDALGQRLDDLHARLKQG